jgi:hypothetical protein
MVNIFQITTLRFQNQIIPQSLFKQRLRLIDTVLLNARAAPNPLEMSLCVPLLQASAK